MDSSGGKLNSKNILGILVLILGLFIVYQLTIADEPRHVSLTFKKGQSNLELISKTALSGHELSVRVDLLEKSPGPRIRTKNLFLSPKPPPPKPRPKPRIVRPRPRPKIISKPVKVGPTPEELSRRELKKFNFLGMIERGGKKEAFITKEDQRFTVKAGQEIIGTIYLKELLEESIILKDRKTGVELKIP